MSEMKKGHHYRCCRHKTDNECILRNLDETNKLLEKHLHITKVYIGI